MCTTHMNCWKIRIRAWDLSLSLFGLRTTLEPQRGCNWHANTLLHCPNSVHSQYRIPFSPWDCCETFPYKTSSVVSGRCAAQHEKVWLFSERGKEVTAFLERFLQRCPTSVPAPVISTCRCVQKHRGKEERSSSCPCSQPVSCSSSIPWPA